VKGSLTLFGAEVEESAAVHESDDNPLNGARRRRLTRGGDRERRLTGALVHEIRVTIDQNFGHFFNVAVRDGRHQTRPLPAPSGCARYRTLQTVLHYIRNPLTNKILFQFLEIDLLNNIFGFKLLINFSFSEIFSVLMQ
jgi:hypothetical protein